MSKAGLVSVWLESRPDPGVPVNDDDGPAWRRLRVFLGGRWWW